MQPFLHDARRSLRESPVFEFYVLATLAVAGFTGFLVGQMALGLDIYLPGLFAQMQHGATESHRVHDYTFTFLVTSSIVAVIAQIGRPSKNIAGALMALIPFAGLAVAAVLADDASVVDGNPFQYIAALALIAVLLHPGARNLRRSFTAAGISPAGVGLVAVASVPLLAYASTQIRLQETAGDAHAAMGHYGMMAAFSFTVIGLGLLASLRPDGWRLPAWATGLLPALVGGMSLMYPDIASSMDRGWALAAIVWGGLFIAVAELGRGARQPTTSSRSDARAPTAV